MLDIEEAKIRTLSELEEAGQEYVSTIINTITEPLGEKWELEVVIEAIRTLIDQDLVRMAINSGADGRLVDASKPESYLLLERVTKSLFFDTRDPHWTSGKIGIKPVPEIVLTDTGLEKSRAILEDRGYQWWRRKP